jgi:Sulfotransferase family
VPTFVQTVSKEVSRKACSIHDEANSSTSRETPGETTEDLGHNPYVFILGCSRSGTTLLQRLVDAHPVIAITSETNWVPRYFEMKTGLTSE